MPSGWTLTEIINPDGSRNYLHHTDYMLDRISAGVDLGFNIPYSSYIDAGSVVRNVPTGIEIEALTHTIPITIVEDWQTFNLNLPAPRSIAVGYEEFSLDVTKDGTGTGSITSAPVGIDCGLDCSEDYSHGTSVELTAVADGGYSFLGWSGDCSSFGANPVCTLDILSNKLTDAEFVKKKFPWPAFLPALNRLK